MESRLKDLAERLDAGLIGRREFLRKSVAITGGTAAGLTVLRRMAHAQSGTKLRIWLFKSYVTAGNDVLARQVEAWAAERKVQVTWTGRPSATGSRSSWPPSRPATRRTWQR